MSETSLTSANPRTLDEQLDSIHQASPIVAVARIKTILRNEDGYTPEQVLLIFEDALTREVRTNPQRRSVIHELKQAIKKASPAKPSAVTVVPALAEIETSLAGHLAAITSKIAGFEDTILADRLKVGLYALKAHMLFTITDKAKQGQGRKSKTIASAADAISPQGFEGWLASNYHPVHHPLKKGTAYAWMTALKGLGLNESATEEEVEEAVRENQRIGPVSIKSLCNAAVEAIAPPAAPPAHPQQSEFEFLRDGLSAFRQQSDALLALKAELHKHPDMERVASARIYSLLVEITGSHWKPSDEPDDLASVNPDAIEL